MVESTKPQSSKWYRALLREILLATALLATLIVVLGERWRREPLDAFLSVVFDSYSIHRIAEEVDPTCRMLDGKLFGGIAGRKKIHRGFVVLDCESASRNAVVEAIKRDIRRQFDIERWKYTENHSTREDWQVTAVRNGVVVQLIFQFVSPREDDRQSRRRLSIQWAELGTANW